MDNSEGWALRAQIAVERQLPKLAFTLADVSVFPVGPTGNTVRLPMVRVIVAQVAAWWPGQIDFGAQADESAAFV